MASSPINSPPVLAIFLVQLLLSSAVIGFTRPQSLIRLAALPLISLCVYYNIVAASSQMRMKWVGLQGGISFVFYLQYIELALLSRWSYETHAEDQKTKPDKVPSKTKSSKKGTLQSQSTTFRQRCSFGWNTMWSLRRVNTKYEVRNAPMFSNDPAYIPTRWAFVTRRALTASICYLVIDFIDCQPPPNREMFSPSLIPIFRRLHEVTTEQLIVRSMTMAGFALTFYCVIQGSYSAVAAVATGLGLSDVKSWRPLFGSITEAYSLQNVWGKFWHQCLRQLITSPSSKISRNVLRLHPGSLADRYLTVFLAFQISAIMHCAAAAAGGRPWLELNVLQFFATQAFGFMLQRAFQRILAALGKESWLSANSSSFARLLGYVWVVAFMTWSGPAWIYPPTSRPPPEGPAGFVPFSVIKYIRGL